MPKRQTGSSGTDRRGVPLRRREFPASGRGLLRGVADADDAGARRGTILAIPNPARLVDGRMVHASTLTPERH